MMSNCCHEYISASKKPVFMRLSSSLSVYYSNSFSCPLRVLFYTFFLSKPHHFDTILLSFLYSFKTSVPILYPLIKHLHIHVQIKKASTFPKIFSILSLIPSKSSIYKIRKFLIALVTTTYRIFLPLSYLSCFGKS